MKYWGLLAVCTFAGAARAQSVQRPTPRGDTTTLSGVFTAAQAARGKNVYAGSCRSCHAPVSHTGQTFERWWLGKKLSELFTFIATLWPKNDPGSLAPEDVADVVAYLLEMNALPAGTRELSAHADSLNRYRIEVKTRKP